MVHIKKKGRTAKTTIVASEGIGRGCSKNVLHGSLFFGGGGPAF